MRNRFAKELKKLAQEHDDIVLLYGDIGNRLFDEFKQLHPDKSFNCGVAESNMVGVAAGITRSGFTPFVYTINTFLYLRAFEQIKLDVCYPNVPVILVGTGSGLSYSELGTTHHSLEDLGVLRQLPNLQIFAPSSPNELAGIMRFAYESKRPTYIRIGKKGEGEVEKLTSVIPNPTYFGPYYSSKSLDSRAVVISCGTISKNVALAAKLIRQENLSLDHIIQPQIAPLDSYALRQILTQYEQIITVEEHNEIGALSAIYSALIAKADSNPVLSNISIPASFHVGLGSLEEARKHLNLDTESIARQIISILK
jgi:transketolase